MPPRESSGPACLPPHPTRPRQGIPWGARFPEAVALRTCPPGGTVDRTNPGDCRGVPAARRVSRAARRTCRVVHPGHPVDPSPVAGDQTLARLLARAGPRSEARAPPGGGASVKGACGDAWDSLAPARRIAALVLAPGPEVAPRAQVRGRPRLVVQASCRPWVCVVSPSCDANSSPPAHAEPWTRPGRIRPARIRLARIRPARTPARLLHHSACPLLRAFCGAGVVVGFSHGQGIPRPAWPRSPRPADRRESVVFLVQT